MSASKRKRERGRDALHATERDSAKLVDPSSENPFETLRSLKRTKKASNSPNPEDSISTTSHTASEIPNIPPVTPKGSVSSVKKSKTSNLPLSPGENDRGTDLRGSSDQNPGNAKTRGSAINRSTGSKDQKRMDQSVVSTFIPSDMTVAKGNHTAIAALRRGETIVFQGAVLAAPIIGSFTIFGARFSPDVLNSPTIRFYPCFSPASHSLLTLEAAYDTDASDHERACKESNTSPDHKIIRELLGKLAIEVGRLVDCGFETVIAFREIAESSGIIDVEKQAPCFRGLFVPREVVSDQDWFGTPGFFPIFTPLQSVAALKVLPTWFEFTHRVISDGSNPIISVIGGRNSGKSTCARFITNRLLQKWEKVAFLECDVGQTELSPSGLISLHVIAEPLLGPPFTHMGKGYRSIYFGAISPKADPDLYLTALSSLVGTFRSELSDVPLIVNTDGWVKGTIWVENTANANNFTGMGFDLLYHTICRVNPTHIVQMSAAENGVPNAADTSWALVDRASTDPGSKWVESALIVRVQGHNDSFAKSKLNAVEHRLLSQITYFHIDSTTAPTAYDFTTSISMNVPYSVSWSNVRLHFMHGEVPLSQILTALNGSIVALVVDSNSYYTPGGSGETEASEEPWKQLRIIPTEVRIQPDKLSCMGLGIIRSIDVESRAFHIVTPVPPNELNKVNLLVRASGVEMPVNLALGSGANLHHQVQTPYVTDTLNSGLGSLSRRTRHNLQRRRGAGDQAA
ncbi:Pre-mRNA cleavage complex II protein Clp1-domain-containing protein [Cladochytrium replicatum]|nr:Pre-mRNA cleavage complex II protein Clp1-domain-containing protein [Cladochytrium replicatum]